MKTRLLLTLTLALVSAAQAADGLYVAVGYGGRRMASRDGRTWEYVQQWSDKGADDANNLMGVAYGKGRWVAVGGGGFSRETQAGHILVSTDGQEWREVARYPFRVNPVLFVGDRFVAGGPSRQLLSSPDGERWSEGEKVTLPDALPGWAFWFRGGAAGNGVFLFYGNANKDQKTWWALTTRDGRKIEQFATDLPAVKGLTFGARRFVLAGGDGVYTSPDGQKWTRETGSPEDELRGVVWNGKEFYLSGKQGSYTSPDGAAWKQVGKAPPCSVVWADERGYLGTGWPGRMFFSTDGVTWTNTGQPAPGLGINRVTYGERPGR
jgi:hypothetical protein